MLATKPSISRAHTEAKGRHEKNRRIVADGLLGMKLQVTSSDEAGMKERDDWECYQRDPWLPYYWWQLI